jgi:hypothetical protein
MSEDAINKSTYMGYTALDLAKQKGWVDVVESIKDCLPKDSFSHEGGEMHELMDGDYDHKISGMHKQLDED